MDKLLEFGRKAMFYVRVLSGYEERRIRSYRLQLQRRLEQVLSFSSFRPLGNSYNFQCSLVFSPLFSNRRMPTVRLRLFLIILRGKNSRLPSLRCCDKRILKNETFENTNIDTQFSWHHLESIGFTSRKGFEVMVLTLNQLQRRR